MKRIFLVVFLLTTGFSLTGCEKHEPAGPRKLFVGKDYETIQQAIDAAKDGDTVAIRVGLYKERIRLKSGVTVAGMSRDKVILEADAAEGPVVTIEGCKGVKLEKITARQIGATDKTGKDKSAHPAVLIRNSQAQISECRTQEITTISRKLKRMAMTEQVPVIALSQLNRQVESRDKHRPRLSDLRESGAIEQDADVVMLLHREDYYRRQNDPQAPQDGTAELIIAKARNKATGIAQLIFLDEMVKFGDKTNFPETLI